MMDFYEAIRNRKSIRSYKTDPVPLETVRKIVEAARMAPSWANRQCWRFLIVDGKVEKRILGEATRQPQIAKACDDAPYVIVLCAGIKDSGRENGMEYFMFDCGLAMENLVLAAAAEALATCIVGWLDEKAMRGVLNVPDGYKIVALTPLGYANENVAARPRKKEEETAYRNSWGKTFK